MAQLSQLRRVLRPGMPGASGGVAYLKGKEQVEANLNKEIEGIRIRSLKGLINAAAHIRNKTENAPPLTPVDLGNLRASWFVATSTSTPRTEGPHAFKGPHKAKFESQHAAMISEGRGQMAAMTTKEKKFLMMGYSVNYAGFVHEFISEMTINWKRPGSGAKWLETHLKAESGKIVEIISEQANVDRAKTLAKH